ncbi:MAG: deoxynucleoside kinase [Pseudomonadota bacterium]
MDGRYVVVEGPIGVGKSQVVRLLAEKLKARTFLDAPNPFLETFYQDMDKYAFQVQLFFLLSRFQQQSQLAQRDLFEANVICDYLFQKDRLFASLTLDASEYSLYEKVYSLLQGTIATPDVVIYLQADVDTLLDRISKKDEGLALLLPDSYMRDIVKAYQAFFFHYDQAPVIVWNTAQNDFLKAPENIALLVRKIHEVRSGVHYLNPQEK